MESLEPSVHPLKSFVNLLGKVLNLAIEEITGLVLVASWNILELINIIPFNYGYEIWDETPRPTSNKPMGSHSESR